MKRPINHQFKRGTYEIMTLRCPNCNKKGLHRAGTGMKGGYTPTPRYRCYKCGIVTVNPDKV